MGVTTSQRREFYRPRIRTNFDPWRLYAVLRVLRSSEPVASLQNWLQRPHSSRRKGRCLRHTPIVGHSRPLLARQFTCQWSGVRNRELQTRSAFPAHEPTAVAPVVECPNGAKQIAVEKCRFRIATRGDYRLSVVKAECVSVAADCDDVACVSGHYRQLHRRRTERDGCQCGVAELVDPIARGDPNTALAILKNCCDNVSA